MKLNALLQVASGVLRRHDLGHHAPQKRHELVVDLLDTGRAHLLQRVLGLAFVVVVDGVRSRS